MMKSWLKEFFYQLTGHYSDRIIDCKSYSIIQYLKATGYKPKKMKKQKLVNC